MVLFFIALSKILLRKKRKMYKVKETETVNKILALLPYEDKQFTVPSFTVLNFKFLSLLFCENLFMKCPNNFRK